MQIAEIALTIAVVIILFEVFPEKGVWSIPVRQADEHMIAVPGSGGFSFFLMQKQEEYKHTRHRMLYQKANHYRFA